MAHVGCALNTDTKRHEGSTTRTAVGNNALQMDKEQAYISPIKCSRIFLRLRRKVGWGGVSAWPRLEWNDSRGTEETYS